MKEVSRKVVLAGQFGVGKTSLVRRFVHHKFSEKYLTTIGVNIEKKTVELGDTKVNMIIWDVSGEKSMYRINGSYFLGSNGIIFVFDLTQPESYLNLEKSLDALQERMPKNVPVILIGNKRDLISDEELEEIRSKIDFEVYAFTSAKTGEMVEDSFLALSKELV